LRIAHRAGVDYLAQWHSAHPGQVLAIARVPPDTL
jgi:hypothetical protein